MLSVELRVNGTLIGVMSIVNKSAMTAVPIDGVTGKSTYIYEYYEFLDNGNHIIESGGVYHKRSDGAPALVELAFADMHHNKERKGTT